MVDPPDATFTDQPRASDPLFPDDPLIVTLELLLVLQDWTAAFIVSRLHYWVQWMGQLRYNLDEDGVAWVQFTERDWSADLYAIRGCGTGTVSARLAGLVNSGIIRRTGNGRATQYTVDYQGLLVYAAQQLAPDDARTVADLLEPGGGREVRVIHPRLVTKSTGLNVTQAAVLQEIHYHTDGGKAGTGLRRSAYHWLHSHFPFLYVDRDEAQRVAAMRRCLNQLTELGFVHQHKDFAFNGDHTYTYTLNYEALESLPAPPLRSTVKLFRQWVAGIREPQFMRARGTVTSRTNQKTATTSKKISATNKNTVPTASDSGTKRAAAPKISEDRCLKSSNSLEKAGSAEPSRGLPRVGVGGDSQGLPEAGCHFQAEVDVEDFMSAPGAELIRAQFNPDTFRDLITELPARRRGWAQLSAAQVAACIDRVARGHTPTSGRSSNAFATRLKTALDAAGNEAYQSALNGATRVRADAAVQYAYMRLDREDSSYSTYDEAHAEFLAANDAQSLIGLSVEEAVRSHCERTGQPFQPTQRATKNGYEHAQQLGLTQLVLTSTRASNANRDNPQPSPPSSLSGREAPVKAPP